MTDKQADDSEGLIYRSPACPLHFGIGYKLDCLNCRAMPTIMPDRTLRDSTYAATTEHHRQWAREEQARSDQCHQ